MRFAICDDDIQQGTQLANMVRALDEAVVCETYTSGEALVADIGDGQDFDAVFLDMEMPGMDGIAAGNAIRAIDERLIIVFVTSHTQYAVASFQCEPLDYLVKPVETERLCTVLEKIRHRTRKQRTTITFEEGGAYVRLYCDEIVYCESVRNGVIIHTKTENYKPRMTLSEVEAQLEPGLFCRSHRSFLVNLSFVRSFYGAELRLTDGHTILPIGRKYAHAFKAAFIAYEERR